MTRIDEIRERLDKATPGPWEVDTDGSGGSGVFYDDEHMNPVCLYAKSEDIDLIANAPADLAWLLDYINDRDALIERLAARVAWYEPRYHARSMALIKIRGLARQAGLPEIQGLANEALTTTSNTKEN